MCNAFKTAIGLEALALVALAPLSSHASLETCHPEYQIDVTLDPAGGRIEGTMTVDLACGEPVPAEVVLWLYPNRFSAPPDLLNAMNTYWIYPYHFNPGGMQILEVSCGGVRVDPDRLRDVSLDEDHPLHGTENIAVAVPVQAQESGTRIEVRYSVRIPKRYGLFGRARGGVVLASGWHPVLAAQGQDGPDLEAPPPEALHQIRLTVPPGYDVVLGDALMPAPGDGASRTLEHSTGPVPSVPVVAFPTLETSRATCFGVEVRWHGLKPRPDIPGFVPGESEVLGLPDKLPDIMSYDRPLMALEVACRTVRLLMMAGAPVAKGTTIDLVEAPLRLELAAATDGPVLVSDRIFDILPARKAWKFHEFQLARWIAATVVRRGMRGVGDPGRAAMSGDFVAAEILERYTVEYHGEHEDARDVLRYGAFLSAIDFFIYSSLVEFREAYFFTMAEKDWLRDEPWAFMSLLPRGKLTHDKLVDLLGEEPIDRVVDGFLRDEGSIHALAEAEAGEDLGWFWSQWSAAYPSLNYLVRSVDSKKLGAGRWRHVAHVERQGDTSIREPVTVRFVMRDGTHEDRVWLEAGPSATLAVEADAKLEKVIVDPEMRLFEDSSLTKNHPRFDNFSRPEWRPPVFAAFAFTSNITDLSGDIDIVFDMRRKFDVISGLRMRLIVATWGQGATAWYSHGLGPKRDLDHATWHVGGFVNGFHHASGYGWSEEVGGETRWHGGTSFSAGLYIDHDNRFYPFNPTDGWSLGLSLGYSLGVDDEKWGSTGGLRHAFSAGTRAFYLWTPVGGHTFAFYTGASGNFGDPYRGQLSSLSSYEILRGFDADETFGRVRLYTCLEYRHLFTHAMHVNFVHYATWVGLQGVLFAGAGTVSQEESYRGLFATDRIFTEVGYGLRAILSYFGTYPGILALDLAVPITPLSRPGRLPVALRLAFNHVF